MVFCFRIRSACCLVTSGIFWRSWPVLDTFAPRLDQSPFEFIRCVDPSHGLLDEAGRTFGVFDVCACDTPIMDRAFRIDCGGLPERSFGFEVPEAVQLGEALVQESLRHRARCGRLPVDISHPRHQVGCLAWSFIEGFGVEGVTGLCVGGFRCLRHSASRMAKYECDGA